MNDSIEPDFSPEDLFLSASTEASTCLGLVYAIGSRRDGEDAEQVREWLNELRRQLALASPVISKLASRLAIQSEGVVGPFDIGWTAIWHSAHQAAIGISEFAIIIDEGPDRIALDQNTFAKLQARLSLERTKMAAELGLKPPLIMTVSAAARHYKRSKSTIGRWVEAGKLRDNRRTKEARRIYVPDNGESPSKTVP